MLMILLAVVIFIIIYFTVNLYSRKTSHFKVGEPASSEYIPQNMSFEEWKKINQWDYPGYLNYMQ